MASNRRRVEDTDPFKRPPTFVELADSMLEDEPGKSLAIADPNRIQVGGFVLTPKGLQIYDGATEDDWQRVGELLFQMADRLPILVGDWANAGEFMYGKTYQAIAEWSGRSVGTIYNWKSVMASVDFSRRREKLLFSHYVEVAPLDADAQEYWLDMAATNNWSISQLRKALVDDPPAPIVKPTKYQRQKERFFNVILRAKSMDERRRMIDEAIGELERLKANLG